MALLPSIEGIEDIQFLVREGETEWESYGDVAAKEKDGLILFNYTIGATLARRWNWFERNARGLILNRETGEVIARPFEKVFNWGENYQSVVPPLAENIVRITEKMDGSLGILYRIERNIVAERRYQIATRGSFDSEQAQWGTRHLYFRHENILDGWLPDECTLLFELIYPENRIVVDYKGNSMMTLLAARNRHTGEYYSPGFLRDVAKRYNFTIPTEHVIPGDAHRISQVIKEWDDNKEGVVAEFSDGSRWKFKAESYVKVHRLLSTLSFKRILEAVKEGTIDDTIPLLPLHIRESVFKTLDEIASVRHAIRTRVHTVFNDRPCESTRKDFALWVIGNHKDLAPYLFSLYDGKDIENDIFKIGFRDYVPQSDLPTIEDE